jgi:hypothetical protein
MAERCTAPVTTVSNKYQSRKKKKTTTTTRNFKVYI